MAKFIKHPMDNSGERVNLDLVRSYDCWDDESDIVMEYENKFMINFIFDDSFESEWVFLTKYERNNCLKMIDDLWGISNAK